MSNSYNLFDYLTPEEVGEVRTRERDLTADAWLKALVAMSDEDKETCVLHFGNDLALHVRFITKLMECGDEVVKLAAIKELEKALTFVLTSLTADMDGGLEPFIEFLKKVGRK